MIFSDPAPEGDAVAEVFGFSRLDEVVEICHQPIDEPRGVIGIECGNGLEVSFELEVA